MSALKNLNNSTFTAEFLREFRHLSLLIFVKKIFVKKIFIRKIFVKKIFVKRFFVYSFELSSHSITFVSRIFIISIHEGWNFTPRLFMCLPPPWWGPRDLDPCFRHFFGSRYCYSFQLYFEFPAFCKNMFFTKFCKKPIFTIECDRGLDIDSPDSVCCSILMSFLYVSTVFGIFYPYITKKYVIVNVQVIVCSSYGDSDFPEMIAFQCSKRSQRPALLFIPYWYAVTFPFSTSMTKLRAFSMILSVGSRVHNTYRFVGSVQGLSIIIIWPKTNDCLHMALQFSFVGFPPFDYHLRKSHICVNLEFDDRTVSVAGTYPLHLFHGHILAAIFREAILFRFDYDFDIEIFLFQLWVWLFSEYFMLRTFTLRSFHDIWLPFPSSKGSNSLRLYDGDFFYFDLCHSE